MEDDDGEGLYFSVNMHHGGSWCTRNGLKHYVGGTTTEFDKCHTYFFNMMELEGMLLQVQWCHGSPLYFWFKPKDKELHDGFELKTDKDLLAMFEDMRQQRYRKVDVYADLSGTFGGNNGELAIVPVDANVSVENTPPAGSKLKRCIIEELPDDANVIVDARVSARPDDYVMSKAVMRDVEEELAENLQDSSGDSDDGVDEFVVYMPDIDMPEFDMEDGVGGSDEDTDSSVQSIETVVDIESDNEGPTEEAYLHPNTQTHAQNIFETPSKPEKAQTSKRTPKTRSQTQGKTGHLNPCTSPNRRSQLTSKTPPPTKKKSCQTELFQSPKSRSKTPSKTPPQTRKNKGQSDLNKSPQNKAQTTSRTRKGEGCSRTPQTRSQRASTTPQNSHTLAQTPPCTRSSNVSQTPPQTRSKSVSRTPAQTRQRVRETPSKTPTQTRKRPRETPTKTPTQSRKRGRETQTKTPTQTRKRTRQTPSKTPTKKKKNQSVEEEDFLEEEYAADTQDPELAEEGATDPSQWWGSVNDLCSQAYQDEDDGGGYEEDDDLVSLVSDEEDGPVLKKKHIEFDPHFKPENIKFELGMEFPTVEHLREALKEHFISIDRQYKYIHNDRLRIRIVCQGEGCKWLMYARRMRDDCTTMRINKFEEEHNCGILWENRLVDANWIAKEFLEKFRANPAMSFGDFKKANLEGKYSKLSSWTFYRAKNKAMTKIHGTVKDQYAILHDYCAILVKLNPGSTTFIRTSLVDDVRYFEMVYICLAACKAGFKFCRPIIGLDGCFLKGYCRGMLLVAIGIDANNNMFPLAYVVVEKENTDSWTWFVQLLKEDLDVQDTRLFTFISDRQKGLERAVAEIYEGSEIRFCVRHLYANFKKEFPGLLLKQQLWVCARATTVEEFKRRMDELKETNAAAFEWLSKKSPSEWTKSHFRTFSKCDMLLNNLCESFNSAILDGRDKEIITLLEYVRYWLMDRMRKQRESVSKWTKPVGKRIFDILQKNRKLAMKCQCTKSVGGLFQVTVSTGQVETTNLETKTCSCRSYDLTGIPCGHALACIRYSNLSEYDFLAECYKKEAFLATYEGSIAPMPGPEHWPNKGLNPILPPAETVLPGRPKKSRRREVDEPPPGVTKMRRFGQSNNCSNCKKPGHTKTTCKQPVQEKEPPQKKKMGRPPKKNPDPQIVKRNMRRTKQQERESRNTQPPSSAN
ncbi:hypothetical protein CsatB_023309 [Cannabis sativa]